MYRDTDAMEQLRDPEFVSSWRKLLSDCPWATSFQDRAFVGPWYAHYGKRFEPLLIIARDAAGALAGLLTLAFNRRGRELVVAGDWQAEYHTWIARPADGDRFMLEAWRLLRKTFGRRPIRFRYLAPGSPVEWLNDRRMASRCRLTPHPRPLYELGDATDARQSLKKVGNRKRLKALSELGPVSLAKITDAERGAAYLDEIITLHDARQAAIRGSTPFRNDPHKRGFYNALLAETKLLHMCLLLAGETVVAGHLGVRTRGDLHMGLLAHQPTLGRTSPGKLLTYELAKQLVAEGVERCDLTAGGEPYKERFSNSHDTVYTLEVYGSATRRHISSSFGSATRWIEQALKARGITRDDAMTWLHSAGSFAQRFGARRPLTGRIFTADDSKNTGDRIVYACRQSECLQAPAADNRFRCGRDDLAALLDDATPLSRWARRRFFAAAMRRMENEQHCLTVATNGRLELLAWFEVPPRARPSESAFVDGDIIVTRIETRARVDIEARLQACLRSIISQGDARVPNARVFVTVDASDHALREAAQACGLRRVDPDSPRTQLSTATDVAHTFPPSAPEAEARSFCSPVGLKKAVAR